MTREGTQRGETTRSSHTRDVSTTAGPGKPREGCNPCIWARFTVTAPRPGSYVPRLAANTGHCQPRAPLLSPTVSQLGARMIRAARFISVFTVTSSPSSPVVCPTRAIPISVCLAVNPNLRKAQSAPTLPHLPSSLQSNSPVTSASSDSKPGFSRDVPRW